MWLLAIVQRALDHCPCTSNLRNVLHGALCAPCRHSMAPTPAPIPCSVVVQRYLCWMHTTPTILHVLRLISTSITVQEVGARCRPQTLARRPPLLVPSEAVGRHTQ